MLALPYHPAAPILSAERSISHGGREVLPGHVRQCNEISRLANVTL